MPAGNIKRKHPSDVAHVLSPYNLRTFKWGRGTRIGEPSMQDLEVAAAYGTRIEPRSMGACCRALVVRLCQEHAAINTDEEILGGMPHIKGTRLSVGTILAKLHHYGNIQAIVDIYEPHLSEEQVKDAIAYAQDFLEIACDPNETP